MPEGEAIEAGIVSAASRARSAKVEARNFDIRKQLRKYDDVSNDQRRSSTSSATRSRIPIRCSTQNHNLRKSAMTAWCAFRAAGSVEEQWTWPGSRSAGRGMAGCRCHLAAESRRADTITDDGHRRQSRRARRHLRGPSWRSSGWSSSPRSCAWCCCRPLTVTGRAPGRVGLPAPGHPPAQATPRRTEAGIQREAFELFSQLLDVVKMEVTRLLLTVRIQSRKRSRRLRWRWRSRRRRFANMNLHASQRGWQRQPGDRSGDAGGRGAAGRA